MAVSRKRAHQAWVVAALCAASAAWLYLDGRQGHRGFARVQRIAPGVTLASAYGGLAAVFAAGLFFGWMNQRKKFKSAAVHKALDGLMVLSALVGLITGLMYLYEKFG